MRQMRKKKKTDDDDVDDIETKIEYIDRDMR